MLVYVYRYSNNVVIRIEERHKKKERKKELKTLTPHFNTKVFSPFIYTTLTTFKRSF